MQTLVTLRLKRYSKIVGDSGFAGSGSGWQLGTAGPSGWPVDGSRGGLSDQLQSDQLIPNMIPVWEIVAFPRAPSMPVQCVASGLVPS